MKARGVLVFAVGAAVCTLLGGCSAPGSGVFPSVLAEPTPRSDSPMTPAEIRQATDDLISERNQLCSQALASEGAQVAAAGPNCANPDVGRTGSTQSAGAGAKP